MSKVPVIDWSRCTGCDSCLEICPQVFRRNDRTGLIEIVDLPEYPEPEVDAAIGICPAACIEWGES